MATYYVNSAGSATAPYDTPAKGAADIWDVRQYAAAQTDATPVINVIANNSNDVYTLGEGGTAMPWGVNASID